MQLCPSVVVERVQSQSEFCCEAGFLGSSAAKRPGTDVRQRAFAALLRVWCDSMHTLDSVHTLLSLVFLFLHRAARNRHRPLLHSHDRCMSSCVLRIDMAPCCTQRLLSTPLLRSVAMLSAPLSVRSQMPVAWPRKVATQSAREQAYMASMRGDRLGDQGRCLRCTRFCDAALGMRDADSAGRVASLSQCSPASCSPLPRPVPPVYPIQHSTLHVDRSAVCMITLAVVRSVEQLEMLGAQWWKGLPGSSLLSQAAQTSPKVDTRYTSLSNV